jgi:hypothetical protein
MYDVYLSDFYDVFPFRKYLMYVGLFKLNDLFCRMVPTHNFTCGILKFH